jgi:cephalosporin hydroxylase
MIDPKSPLRQFVRVKNDKDVEDLSAKGHAWAVAAEKNRLDYEIDWLGMPIIQTPQDMVLIQEVIYRTEPDVIVETGVAHGGSLIFYSSLLEVFKKTGRVIGVDIEIREHNRRVIEAHPLGERISLIEGSSIAPEVVSNVKKEIGSTKNILVCLDSNHYKDHVLQELKLYAPFVNVGSYIVVFDTATSLLVDEKACDESYRNNGPLEAVQEFLKETDCFVIDEHYNRLYVTASPNGYLKRVK